MGSLQQIQIRTNVLSVSRFRGGSIPICDMVCQLTCLECSPCEGEFRAGRHACDSWVDTNKHGMPGCERIEIERLFQALVRSRSTALSRSSIWNGLGRYPSAQISSAQRRASRAEVMTSTFG